MRKNVSGGVQTTRYQDGEFDERWIFYFKTRQESEKLPPEIKPKTISEAAHFNFTFRKWEDLGIKNGKRLLYYGSGKSAGYIEVIDGKYEGEMVIYWPNKKIKKKVIYHNGQENGLAYFYNRRGQLLTTFTMRNGIVDGEACKYDKTGKIIFKGEAKHDRNFIERFGFLD
ncbi:toxin-antitoxin system YwqK family antitoxin [Leptospira neocaledonica]|nr:hypothetical protein [Leptospira neocaledonica]